MFQEYTWHIFLALVTVSLILIGAVTTKIAGEESSDKLFWIVGYSALFIMLASYAFMVFRGRNEPYLWSEGDDWDYFGDLRRLQYWGEGRQPLEADESKNRIKPHFSTNGL